MGETQEFRTIPEIYLERMGRGPDRVQLSYKEGGRWVGQTGRKVIEYVRSISLGLYELGVRKGDRVAILSNTRMEWTSCDLADLSLGAVTVGIYHTYPPEAVHYILDHSGSKVVFVEDDEQLDKVLEILPRLDPAPRVVSFQEAAGQHQVLSLDELREKGEERHREEPDLYRRLVDAVEPGDLATLVYTSGTTGPPKGAMCTHANLYAAISASHKVLDLRPDDVSLIFLPMAHVLQRQALYAGFLGEGTGAYAESLDSVMDDFQDVRPTVQPSVPRIWEKFYTRIQQKLSEAPPHRRALAWLAFAGARRRCRLRLAGRRVPGHLELAYRLFDRLVFRRLRQVLGGRVRYFISGGAPIALEILEFFHSVGMPIYEGYGLTETSAPCNLNGPRALRLGSVGRPLPGIQQRIAGDGEILVKGPSVFAGYYKDPETTAEAFTEDGWFRTGDIGRMDRDGYLYITDRKKDLIVTAGGMNVAPQNIENLLKNSPLVSQASRTAAAITASASKAMVIGSIASLPYGLLSPSPPASLGWEDVGSG